MKRGTKNKGNKSIDKKGKPIKKRYITYKGLNGYTEKSWYLYVIDENNNMKKKKKGKKEKPKGRRNKRSKRHKSQLTKKC